jgi:two-component system, sensor histidine kinase and response regulator
VRKPQHILLFCLTWFLLINIQVRGQVNVVSVDSMKAELNRVEGREKVDLLNELSRAYWDRSFKTALGYSTQSYELATRLNYFEGMADATNRIGNIYYFLRDTAKALDFYRRSLEIAQAIGNEKRKGIIYNNLGILYASFRNYEKAIPFYQMGLEAKIKDGDKSLIASSFGNLGNALYLDRNYKDALINYEQYTKIWEGLNDSLNIARGYELMGMARMMQKDFEKSIKDHTLAYNIRSELLDSIAMAQSLFRIGQNLLRMNRLEGAKIHFENALETAEKVNHINLIRDIYAEISLLKNAEKDYAEAYNYHLLHSDLKDSILKRDANQLMNELKLIYETEFAENQASLLSKENEIQNSLLKKESQLRNYLTVIIILIFIITGIIISRYYLKIRLNNKLKDKIQTLEEVNIRLKKSEESLQRMNATKDKFFGIIAHDLKNPFNALMGFSEMLSENLEELTEKEITHYVEVINNSAKSLYRLLENLLLWSASQTGNIGYAPEKFDLRVLAQKELSLLKVPIQKRGINVINKIAPGIVVYADMELISRVFSNLLDNAIKFSHEGGTVTLSAVALKKYAEISIADSGVGMSEEEIQNLFKLDNGFGDSSESRGTGLGLILCKHYIERNSGFIDVISTKNKGTTFIFSIPVAEKV